MNYTFKIFTLLFFASTAIQLSGQSNFSYDQKHDLSSVYYTPFKKPEGFSLSLSLVAMFTSGAPDRNGLRIGAGLTLSQTIGDWTLSTGFDTYKARQQFGLGTTFAGAAYDDMKFGGSYYLNKYWQGDKQLSGILAVHLDDFRIRFEDDILALPFTGFVVYDRYRSAALELEYKGFLLGTNVYTNEPNGLLEESLSNAKGKYSNGLQISSPIYVGYTNRNLILRYGLSNKTGGYIGQNWWHEYMFDTSNFKSDGHSRPFFQLGIAKPYSLY